MSRPGKAHGGTRRPALARWIASGAVLALAAGSYAADQAISPSPASAAETYPTTIAAGYNHSCMIVTGQAYCWGGNTYGELGDNSTVSSTAPVPVDTSGVLSGVTLTQITAGNGYTCPLASTGRAYCWGYNADGELGDSSTANSSVPVPVTTSGALSGTTLTQISAGEYATCGVSGAGAAYCWGLGSSGQLGNGGTSSPSRPVTVSASVRFGEISAGYNNTCALSMAGAAYCWGSNNDGQLGSGSTAGRGVPVAVHASGVMSGRTLTQITAGQYQTCAVDSPGSQYCWGLNSSGQRRAAVGGHPDPGGQLVRSAPAVA